MRNGIAVVVLLASSGLGGALGAVVRGDSIDVAASAERRRAEAVVDADVRPVRARRHVRAGEEPTVEAEPPTQESDDPPDVATAPPAGWDGLPITVRVVHGETGATLSGARVAAAEGYALWRRPKDERRYLLDVEGDVHRLRASLGRPGGDLSVSFDVTAPPGLVVGSDDAVERALVDVSPFARSLAVTVPLRRAIDVDVDARAPSRHRIGRRLTGISVTVGDESFFPPMQRPYRARVPFFRGEDLVVRAETRTSWGESVVPLMEFAERIDMDVVVDREIDRAGGYRGPSGSVRGCGGPRNDPPGDAVLDVLVRLLDGRPAAGASARAHLGRRTEYATVDERGRARFRALPEGVWRVEVTEDGMVRTTGTVDLGPREHAVLRLREPVGETAEITVVNHRGARLPFARVDVEDCGLAPGGVQLLDHYTGPDGTCRIERLSDEPHSVVVRWAGRIGHATWRPGEPVTITLPPPR